MKAANILAIIVLQDGLFRKICYISYETYLFGVFLLAPSFFFTGFSFFTGFVGATGAAPETEAEVEGDAVSSSGISSSSSSSSSSSNGGLLELDGIGGLVPEKAEELEPGAPGAWAAC